MNRINPDLVAVRNLEIADLPLMLQYWYHSPPDFLESMAVDRTKMKTETEMATGLTKWLRQDSKLAQSKMDALTITYDGRAIGQHAMNPVIEGESGVMHAHIWDPDFRRRGVGLSSYPMASRVFIERFNLKRILFKTPVQNLGAIRVKEKLGIRAVGEEILDYLIVKAGTRARVFELTRDEVYTLFK